MTSESMERRLKILEDLEEARESPESRTSLSTEFLHAGNLATLPTGGLRDGAQAWVSDGRKSGEGAGAGTGVIAYFDATQVAWLSLRDDSAVTT